jgi:hypothetical protein
VRPTKKRNASRLHQPADMSLEVWQRELRRQFGGEQTFRIENIGEHPIFSEFRITNPARGSVYRVAIRGAEADRNFCSCADFKTNALGTCKHIEALRATDRERRRVPSATCGVATGNPYRESEAATH